MSEKSTVYTDRAPAPAHTFGQAVKKGGFLQVSGQGPMDPELKEFIGLGDVKAQTRRTLDNINAILAAGDSSMEDAIMVRVYLTQQEDFAGMNQAYEEFINETVPSGVLPSRTTVFVGLPHPEMLVEIDVLAVAD